MQTFVIRKRLHIARTQRNLSVETRHRIPDKPHLYDVGQIDLQASQSR